MVRREGVEPPQLSRVVYSHLGSPMPGAGARNGARDGSRTRYLDLGKVALYQMSYSRKTGGRWGDCGESDSGDAGHNRTLYH